MSADSSIFDPNASAQAFIDNPPPPGPPTFEIVTVVALTALIAVILFMNFGGLEK